MVEIAIGIGVLRVKLHIGFYPSGCTKVVAELTGKKYELSYDMERRFNDFDPLCFVTKRDIYEMIPEAKFVKLVDSTEDSFLYALVYNHCDVESPVSFVNEVYKDNIEEMVRLIEKRFKIKWPTCLEEYKFKQMDIIKLARFLRLNPEHLANIHNNFMLFTDMIHPRLRREWTSINYNSNYLINELNRIQEYSSELLSTME